MTNSFIPAPDYSSILEQSFSKINASLAKAEQMERDNDRRRLQNAAVPLQVFESLIDFSTTAAKTFKLAEANKWAEAKSEGPTSEALQAVDQDFNPTVDSAFELASKLKGVETKIEFEALKNNDTDIAQEQKFGTGHISIGKRDYGRALVAKAPILWAKFGFDKKFNEATTLQAKQRVFKEFNKRIKLVAAERGINERTYNKFVAKDINAFGREKLNKGNQDIQKQIYTDRFKNMRANLSLILRGNPEEIHAKVAEFKDENRGYFPDDLNGVTKFVFDVALTEKDIPPEIVEILKKEPTIHKGTGKLTELEKILNEQQLQEYDDFIYSKQKEIVEKHEQKVETDRKSADIAFKREEAELLKNEGRRFTEDEIKEKIKEWRANSVYPIPESYKTALSVEDQVEEDVVDRLSYKYANKIPIYEEDLIGLQDPDKIRYWRPLQQSSDQWAIPQDIKSMANGRLDTITSKWLKETTASNDKSDQWRITRDNAGLRYLERYEYYSDKESTPLKIHDRALADVKAEILNGDHDAERAIDPKNRYALNIEMAHSSIAANKNIISSAVIPGTEEALKEAIENPNTIPKMYKDIASQYKTMSPHDLMYAQMEAAGNKVEKDPVTKEVEKLDPNVQQLLKHHPTHGRVARALLEEYQKDGEITYDDVEFLLEEAIDQKLEDAGYVTPQLGEMKPETGDWQTLENGTYVVFDGEQWQQRGVFFTNKQPYTGNIEEYLDKDLIRRKF